MTSSNRFKLTQKFLSEYEGKQPNWGFGDLSYFVYKRTYARIKEDGTQEEFFDTVKRVVEGCFQIQLDHCSKLGLPWDGMRAQKSAQKMFHKVWEFKFSPPGRGLWVMGTPIVDRIGSAALNNCFAGSTEIITNEGAKPISSLVNTNPTILTEGGKWVTAPVRSFGKQKIWELELSRQGVRKVIRTTGDHRWFCLDKRQATRDKGYVEFFTKDLRPGVHRLQSCFGQGIKATLPSPFGIAHGITFGDGTRNYANDGASARIKLIGEKNLELTKYFDNCSQSLGALESGIATVEASQLPNFFKKLPDIKENKSYLFGFLAGYFAADGTVAKDGSPSLSSTSKENLEYVRDICYRLGIGTYGICTEERLSNLTKDASTLYKIVFMRTTLTEEFFLLSDHRIRFLENSEPIVRNWNVVSVKETEDIEEVYCATVPGYGKFTLADNILTGNCAFISTKEIKKDFGFPFSWACDMLMLGVGVGFDTNGAESLVVKKPTGNPVTFVIPDSREGWVESIKILINSYSSGNPITFDYSQIRVANTPIKGFGGTSSGPEPLKNGHKEITELLDSLDGEPITSTAIVDIMNMIGKFVVAGNVRRSAELAIGQSTDANYVTMKDPIKHSKELMSHRWASNNSVFAKPTDDFSGLIDSIAKNGEPGLIFLDNAKHYGRLKDGFNTSNSVFYDNVAGFNPCAEQSLEHGEMCCLVETYPANHDSAEEFLETIKYAYLYAKSVTLLPTHDPLANSVMLKNRRIGLSQSGIQQAIKKFGYSSYCKNFADEAYDMVRKWDQTYSRWLGVPTSNKVTTVKPSGTVSLLSGATPGVHCTHSEFYFRTVRVSATDPMVSMLLKANYRVEVSVIDNAKIKDLSKGKLEVVRVTEDNLPALREAGVTLVVYFGIKEKNFTKSKYDISLWEQLYLVRELQSLWSDNSVSCTITFKLDEKKDLESAIKFVAPYVKTLSFLPLDNHSYAQAPYQTITEQQYTDYVNSLKTLKLKTKSESSGERYCTNDSCVVA